MNKRDALDAFQYAYALVSEKKYSQPWCVFNTLKPGFIQIYADVGYARVGTCVPIEDKIQLFCVQVNAIKIVDAIHAMMSANVDFLINNGNIIIKSDKQRVILPLQQITEQEKMDSFFQEKNLGNLLGVYDSKFINQLFALAKANNGAIYFDTDYISMVPHMGLGPSERKAKDILFYKMHNDNKCSIHMLIPRSFSFPQCKINIYAYEDQKTVNITIPNTRIEFERLDQIEQCRADRVLYNITGFNKIGHAAMPSFKIMEKFGDSIISWNEDGTAESCGGTDGTYIENIDGSVKKNFKTGVQLIKDGEFDIYEHPQLVRFENEEIIMISGKIIE